MIQVYVTREGRLVPALEAAERNSWVRLTAPSEPELQSVAATLDIPDDLLRAALDEEEQPRLEFDGQRVLVLLRCPVARSNGDHLTRFETLPLGVVVTLGHVVTVCLEPNEAIEQLLQPAARVHTAKRTLFLLQVLYRVAVLYLRYLRLIDRRSDEIERALHQSMRNEELIRLLELEKSLVYFITSLRANQIVMDRLMRLHLRGDPAAPGAGAGAAVAPANGAPPPVLRLYEEDRDLLEDVITENRQAIEMAEIHSNILSSTMDAFASIISNNLNIVMKFLTSVTIVLALPTIVASIYGMNVVLPLQEWPGAFVAIVGGSVALSAGVAWFLSRRGMF